MYPSLSPLFISIQRNSIGNNMVIMVQFLNTLAAELLPKRSAFSVIPAVPRQKSESRPEDQLGQHEGLHHPHAHAESHRPPLLHDSGRWRHASIRHVLCVQTRSAALRFSSGHLADMRLCGEFCSLNFSVFVPSEQDHGRVPEQQRKHPGPEGGAAGA